MTISKADYERHRAKTLEMFEAAGIVLSADEKENVEVADFGLDDLDRSALQLITYINTDRVCAKELVLFPGQTCPEHLHPPAYGGPGKEETFRCRRGEVYLYVEGEPAKDPIASPPEGDEEHYTVWHEIVLKPGEQHTIYPETLHWFQAGPQGCIVSEFSTRNTDDFDQWTDPRIKREPEVEY